MTSLLSANQGPVFSGSVPGFYLSNEGISNKDRKGILNSPFLGSFHCTSRRCVNHDLTWEEMSKLREERIENLIGEIVSIIEV